MKRSRARRTALVTLASAAIHAVLLALLAIGVPELGPEKTLEQPVVQVILEPPPREPPPPVEPTRPRKHPTSTPRPSAPAPVPPPNLHVAPTLPNGPAYETGGRSGDKGSLVRTLRGSVGCSYADFVGLTEAERDACQRRLRAALPDAGRLSGLTAEKQARFDHASACQEAWRIYRASAAAPMPRLRDCPPWE
jgi:hypothetical protein